MRRPPSGKRPAVTPEAAHQAFVRYVKPDQMLVVVVGKEKPKAEADEPKSISTTPSVNTNHVQ